MAIPMDMPAMHDSAREYRPIDFPKKIDEPVSDSKDAAVPSHILPQDNNPVIFFHLLA
jgi:hypothetical protein